MQENSNISEALPHSDINDIFDNVYMVTGTYIATYGDEKWQFSRNMTIIREGKDLTLINAIRLNERGLKALEQLGTVKNLVKLGAAHGIDNAFYAKRYHASVWGLPGDEQEDHLIISERLAVNHLPISHAALHCFNSSSKPEAIFFLKQHGGIIITCDSIKNWSLDDEFFSHESMEKMNQYGMIHPVDIDKNWISSCCITVDDFKNLLSLPFKHLIPGHGKYLRDSAHEEIEKAIAITFS